MADELNGATSTDPVSNPISEMFGKGGEASQKPADGVQAPQEGSGEGTPSTGRPEWLSEAFWKANESGDGGEINVEGLSKSWRDTRASLNTANERIKALEKGSGSEAVPETADEYYGGVDLAELEKASPKAFAATSRSNMEEAKQLLVAAHKNGVGPEKARAILSDYYASLEGLLPDTLLQSEQDRMSAAIKHQGAHGQRVADDVETWLSAKAERGSFNDEQLGVLRSLVQSGPGLSLLYGLMRETQRSGPPVGMGQIRYDRSSLQEEFDKLAKDPDILQDPKGQRRLEELHRQIHPHLDG